MSQSSNRVAESQGNTYIRRDLLWGFGSAQLWELVKQHMKAVAFVFGAEAQRPQGKQAGGRDGREEGNEDEMEPQG